MPKLTYDANIFINRKPRPLPTGFYMSVVVLQELVAGAKDASAVQEFERSRNEYRKADKLLVPTEEDWWQVGIIINSLQRGRRSRKDGKMPKMAAQEKYRITNDVLIARTAKRAGVTVITDNIADFNKIRKFCDVKVMSGSQYFSKD